MDTDKHGIVDGGGWASRSVVKQPWTNRLSWMSFFLLFPACAAGVMLEMTPPETSELSIAIYIGCWALISITGLSWLATALCWWLESPTLTEETARNPDYDPKNLY